MRFIVNILLKCAVLFGLNWLGWVTLLNPGPSTGLQAQVGTALIVVVLFTVASILVAVFTFGLALLLMPFYGWLILTIVHAVIPTYLELNPNFWLVVLSGLFLAVVRWPSMGANDDGGVKV